MTKLPKNGIAGETASVDRFDGEFRRGPGRPTIDDDTLCQGRNALVWLLSTKWGDCGWQIQNATTVDEVRQAFEPLRGHPPEHLIAHFRRATSRTATASEVRSTKKAQGKAVERARGAQEDHDRRS